MDVYIFLYLFLGNSGFDALNKDKTEISLPINLLMITDNEKSRMIEHFMAQVKTEDMINLAFMKPFEVALRTHRTDKSVPSDSLPRGLMIAQKNSINDNKYSLKRI